jgi:hypothetical protein
MAEFCVKESRIERVNRIRASIPVLPHLKLF